MCDRFLANPVIEQASIRVEPYPRPAPRELSDASEDPTRAASIKAAEDPAHGAE